MKSAEEIMEILEAFDLTGSCRDAAVLAGCSHHTVANYVAARQEGRLTPGRCERRAMLIDAFLPKFGGVGRAVAWSDPRGCGARQAGALGYAGSERTTRRAVAEVKVGVPVGPAAGASAVDPGAGMRFQYDFGDGPRVDGVGTQLFCAWLAWCRFRVVLALLDKTLPSVMAAIDQALRIFGGVTVEHVDESTLVRSHCRFTNRG